MLPVNQCRVQIYIFLALFTNDSSLELFTNNRTAHIVADKTSSDISITTFVIDCSYEEIVPCFPSLLQKDFYCAYYYCKCCNHVRNCFT